MRDALVLMLLLSAAGRSLEVPAVVEDRLYAQAGRTDIESLIVGFVEIDDMPEAIEKVLHRPRPNTWTTTSVSMHQASRSASCISPKHAGCESN